MKAAYFSDEPNALAILEECDYNIKISLREAKEGIAKRQVRVYADGVYDVFHSGHSRQLMQAKNAFPNIYLIAGVCSEVDTNRLKGQTVMTEEERCEAVRHCRYVDEVVKNAPWICHWEFVQKHKIDFVAHDDIPYEAEDSEDVYKIWKDKDMFLVTQRTDGISTTEVVSRIVKDYDGYLRRNIHRGLSRHELNISYAKEKSLLFQEKCYYLKESGKHVFDIAKRLIIDRWESRANDLIRSFTYLFEKTKIFQNQPIEDLSTNEDELETSPESSASENN